MPLFVFFCRWWVFHEGKVLDKAMPKDAIYNVAELRDFLRDRGYGAQSPDPGSKR